MKLALALSAAALFVWRVAAADCISIALTEIPSCAQSCFIDHAPEIGCGGTDFTCQCNKRASLMSVIEGCVAKSCTADQYQAVIDGGDKGWSRVFLPTETYPPPDDCVQAQSLIFYLYIYHLIVIMISAGMTN